ncbi:biotin synthase BioB [Thalassovita mediterranea]|jgi:biotin synthase|uniref:Biotin synthase n=1 Tax=Thalassovita mediterranea TaxID=340021 RepID=A0A0P1GPI8_9RHOB|nr:biotin synthase BioB [Thalassovita mediterranea]CUH84456.1 Biotin synthase [Thalassovita mediterranea]SIS34266.1 biotin synthase [Thalassovita mediterranea]
MLDQDPQKASLTASEFRSDWTVDEVEALLRFPLLDLVGRANEIHRRHHDAEDIQKASLLSIKTGGCPEDCAYCPQSAHHKEVDLDKEKLMNPKHVVSLAKRAQQAGAERFCMGAAWRRVRDGQEFDNVLEMVRGVNDLGMEACVTLGMLEPHQAQALAEAGLKAYNHNLDTSPEFYGEIIGTRTYQDRLETLAHCRDAGLDLCCGGIIGMGESWRDRASMLQVLAGFDPHPESVPINALIATKGTPLEHREKVQAFDLLRMVATARILMPKTRVRLSAGRSDFSAAEQALCFLAGANSVFYGDVLLTAPNAGTGDDRDMFAALGSLSAT